MEVLPLPYYSKNSTHHVEPTNAKNDKAKYVLRVRAKMR